MYEKWRRPGRAKNILAYFIFGAIIIVFIGFGASQKGDRGSDSNGVAAVVNQSQISLVDFEERVKALEKQFQFRFDQAPAEQREQFSKFIRQRALEDLIQYEILVQQATDRGIRVADDEIRDFVLDIPAFQDEGRFKRDRYQAFLQQRRESAGQFEERIRKDMIVRKAEGLFRAALRPSMPEKELGQTLDSYRLKLTTATLSEAVLNKQNTPTAAEIDRQMSQPEFIAALKKSYDSQPANWQSPEEVKARHILISIDRSKPESEKLAKQKMDDLAKRAQSENFAELAKENSEDPGSKAQGGDLGYFGRGRMVPEFEKAAFGASPGKIVGPIRSDFGFHLIKVEDHRPSRTRTFDEVKREMAQSETLKKASEQLKKRLSDALSKGDESEVRGIVKSLGVAWSDPVEASLPGDSMGKIENPEAILDAVLRHGARKGVVPELIKAQDKSYVAILLDVSRKAPTPLSVAGFANSRSYGEAFGNWTKQGFEQAKIQRNGRILMP
jgi:peptidyl-prolyl cis-trans isomerase D